MWEKNLICFMGFCNLNFNSIISTEEYIDYKGKKYFVL